LNRRKTQAVGKKNTHKKDVVNSDDDVVGDSGGDKGIISGEDGSTKENCGASCLMF